MFWELCGVTRCQDSCLKATSTPLGLLHWPLGQIAFAQLADELVPFVPHPTRRSDDAIPRSHADRKTGHLDRESQRLSEDPIFVAFRGTSKDVRALSRAGLIETTSNASIGTNRRVTIVDGCSTKRVAGLSDGGSCCDRNENASQKNDSARHQSKTDATSGLSPIGTEPHLLGITSG